LAFCKELNFKIIGEIIFEHFGSKGDAYKMKKPSKLKQNPISKANMMTSEISQLLEEHFPNENKSEHYTQNFNSYSTWIYTNQEDDKIIGFCIVEEKNKKESGLYIAELSAQKDYEKNEIGEKLLTFLDEEYPKQNQYVHANTKK